MCTTNVFVRVHPDGRRSTTPQVVLCPNSRFGRLCAAHVEVHHPAPHDMMLPPPVPPMAPAAPIPSFPPSPTYSPRPPSRESASDAERRSSRRSSRHSSSSSARRQRSPGIYVNGQRVVDSHGHPRRERILLVPNPPTPRTPPQSFEMPRTAPASPSANLSVPYGSSPRESYNRPYIVDERPRIHVQLNAGPAMPPSPTSSGSSRHSRQTSTSSHGSRHGLSAAEEEERRRRHQERRDARKAQELLDRIAQANAEIASRPAVRVVNAEPQSERRGRKRNDDVEDVVGAMAGMSVKDKNWSQTRAHEKALKLEKEEQAAQDERLRERMVPRRRATVGPGSRRHRVAYDDGLYRWE